MSVILKHWSYVPLNYLFHVHSKVKHSIKNKYNGIEKSFKNQKILLLLLVLVLLDQV